MIGLTILAILGLIIGVAVFCVFRDRTQLAGLALALGSVAVATANLYGSIHQPTTLHTLLDLGVIIAAFILSGAFVFYAICHDCECQQA